jgi:murein DD-endopeptidase MepM/ murein hydrolase activator NlpD
MKKFVQAVMVMVLVLAAQVAGAHSMYLKKNPTNENGIEFGVDNASGFSRWRAYVRGVSNNSQGQNTGWKDSGNGWWYYDLASVSQRVMWRLDGLANQELVITYWVFRSDNSWEYGPQVSVISDQILPDGHFTNLTSGQKITSQTYNLSVSSSDNLSGVEAVRIYVVIPAGNSLPGWTASGLANQYYKEFSTASVSQNFCAPAKGNYTFTLWVKDRAGNINYEPGGQYAVIFDWSTEPPPVQTPAAPSNLTLNYINHNVVLTWQDNANNEEGFKIYRYSQQLVTLPANTEAFTDLDLDPGQNYCYKVYAFIGSQNSQAAESCILIDEQPPADDWRYADGFQYPLDCDYIHRISPDSQVTTGECFDYQPFGSLFAVPNKVHLGADLNIAGIDDLGEPIYAVANGLVWEAGWTQGWGYYLILQITAADNQSFILSNGQTVTQVYAFYGHLQQIAIINDDGLITGYKAIVNGVTRVKRGWQIGTMGDGNGNYSPHLHFEIRTNGYRVRGTGYYPVDDTWYLSNYTDPIEFLDNNWHNAKMRLLKVIVHGYDTDPNQPVCLDLDRNFWRRQGRNYAGAPVAAVGWSNYLWLSSSANNFEASWHFQVPISGAWSVFFVLPRYYGQATKVRYQIEYGDGTLAPLEIRFDQKNDDLNQLVYVPQALDFYQNRDYRVVVHSQTADNPAKDVAVDALILIYDGDLGSGGGEPLDNGSIKTIESDGDLTFSYQGSYHEPELHCFGAGLNWDDLILSGGQKTQTIAVLYSDTVLCNIEFEDGEWLANWQGILNGQQLLVNDEKITALQANGLGGFNLVFKVVLPNDDNNTPPQNQKGYDHDQNSAGWGCAINPSVNLGESLINFFLIISPAFIIYGWKKIRKIL